MLSLLLACDVETRYEASSTSSPAQYNEPYDVQIAPVKSGNFEITLSFRGKLTSSRSTIMQFPSSGVIEQLKVNNGDLVRKGQLLAKLNDEKESINLKKARNNLRNANLSKEYTKIGYAPSGENISEKAMEAINLQSGYEAALLAIEEAELNLKNREIYAPFDGKIVDLKARQFENSNDHEFFCRIIDPNKLVASFSIVEEEIRAIRSSEKISVSSHIDPSNIYHTTSFSINPVVNENGFSEVSAEFEVDPDQIWDGMSVNINAIKTFKNTLFIPKSAVVRRNDQNVVFTLTKGLAKWNYVELDEQNQHFWSISSGLTPGDTVIISGNLNLADGVPVNITDPRL
ncbi:MAG: efflux RND transporter periplasmic adaptor subunit [Cytophagales bacterium]|nr:efflux RND transporter periplasmic adaptor subunit [Cytophagales bacterium]